MVDQYEVMQKQMQKIRESHGITANPKLMKPNLAYTNMHDDDSSSDLSSDDDDIDGLDDGQTSDLGDSSNTSQS